VGTAASVRFLPLQHEKHTVQLPTRRSTREAKVNQKPGPVFVVTPVPKLSSNCILTSAKRAISTQNAITVKRNAKIPTTVEITPMIGELEHKTNKKARAMAMVATG